jgi:hypothetical protein
VKKLGAVMKIIMSVGVDHRNLRKEFEELLES